MIDPVEILGPKGRIAARLEQYEERPQQLEMAWAVAAAIEGRRHLIVEAGTGVGKSFAYLVPAILAATAEPPPSDDDGDENRPRRRIVVSTHTIALQEQLVLKDIPLLKAVMPNEFTAVLVKGRGNYVSLRRLKAAQDRARNLFIDDSEIEQLRELASWAKQTIDGSLSDLPFSPQDGVWDEIKSDSGNCMGRNCPTYDTCFYYQARRRASRAQILVVNHALFFSDLALRRAGASILPDYEVAILDEAHTVESVAGDHLGLGISSGAIEYTLNKLYNDRTNKGLLVHYKLGAAQQEVERCRVRADDFFADINRWLEDQTGDNGRVLKPEIVPNLLSPALETLARMVRQPGDKIKDEKERFDFISAADRLRGIAAEIDTWVKQQLPKAVYWIERIKSRRGHTRFVLCAAPIDIGPALREQLFEKVPSVVMTSATLAIGRSIADDSSAPGSAGGQRDESAFHYFKSRIGLTQSDCLRLGSPFDYQSQVELILVDGMPDPTEKALRAGLPGNDPPLRGSHRRPGVRAIYQLRHAPPRGQRPDAVAGPAESGAVVAGRRPASQPNARPLPSEPAQRAVGHRHLLARGRCARRRPAERDHHEAPVQRARPAAVGGPTGGHPRGRRQPICRLPIARSCIETEARFRPPDPNQNRHRHCRDPGPPSAPKRYGRMFLDSLPQCHQSIESVAGQGVDHLAKRI